MLLVIIIGAISQGIWPWERLRKILDEVFDEVSIVNTGQGVDFGELKQQIAACDAILVLENEAPKAVLPKDVLSTLQGLIVTKCFENRKRVAHILKNNIEDQVGTSWIKSNRARKVFWFYYLKTTPEDALMPQLEKNKSVKKFSSPGESFAWQLAAGFLSYILPNLRGHIRASLFDQSGCIRQDLLTEFRVTGIDPTRILVVPRFLLVLDERIVLGQQSVSSMCPQHLFPGCSKICSASTELSLEFDSPGYKKRVPAYLMQLEQPLTKGQSTFTHAVIFGGYAAPMFVMQKLSMSDEEKKQMFEQFRDELSFIQHHPRANAILRELSDCSSDGVSESEPSALHVIDMKEEDSLRSSIVASIEDFLLFDDWTLVSENENGSSLTTPGDEVPFMSMAFAMAANVWFGFAQLVSDYLSQLSTDGEQMPFDLPYFFVIPRSGRFPDESKLLSRFAEVGAQSSVQEFRAASGRRYSFRVHEWRSRTIAFEIPPCVLGLRRQAECGVGGIDAGDLPTHLAEFRDALSKLAADGGDRFRVVEWDDVTGFEELSCIDNKFAVNLLDFLDFKCY